MTPAQALQKKLLLERRLLPQLAQYNKQLLREFTATMASAGYIAPTQGHDAQLAAILRNHYAMVTKAFAGAISDELPPAAASTSKEREAMAAALAAFYAKTANDRAAQINRSTDDDLRSTVMAALDVQEPDKPALSRVELALLAAGLAHRLLGSRANSIAVTETQLAAEATRATEAEVLLGLQPSVSGGGQRQTVATKIWESVRDNRVRDAHLAADGQEVPVGLPFVVDGESLMFPGDSNLGASPGNVINCRCGVSYNTAEIAQHRMED